MLEYPGRYDENELTVAVVHALASLTSTTSCAILVVAGLVSTALLIAMKEYCEWPTYVASSSSVLSVPVPQNYGKTG